MLDEFQNPQKLTHATFLDFLEMLCRVADVVSFPTAEELAAWGANHFGKGCAAPPSTPRPEDSDPSARGIRPLVRRVGRQPPRQGVRRPPLIPPTRGLGPSVSQIRRGATGPQLNFPPFRAEITPCMP